jgi:AcrR family transcriptional regulator
VPRAGLTPGVVIAEAGRVADEVGFSQLTLSTVAARLGVAVPSLYKHVPGGLEGVRHGLTLLALEELGASVADAGGSLASLSTAFRDYARTHPGRYEATVRAVDPADESARAASDGVLSTVLDVLAGYGLSGDEAIDAARALRASIHGFVALEAAGGFGLPRAVDRSFERMIEMLDAGMRSWPVPRTRRRSEPPRR